MIAAVVLGLIAGVFMAWVNLSNHELHRLDAPLILSNRLVKLILGSIPIILVIFSFIQFGLIEGVISIGAALLSHTFVWVRAERKKRKIMGESRTEETSVDHTNQQRTHKSGDTNRDDYDYLVNKYLAKEDTKIEQPIEGHKHKTHPNMVLVGVGGAGVATINRISKYDKLPIKKYVAIDSDVTALRSSLATTKIKFTKSEKSPLDMDATIDIDRMMKVLEVEDEIINVTKNSDIAFLVAGVGGNTGASSWHIVADILKKQGTLVVVYAIKPFSFEDNIKKFNSDVASEMKKDLDVVIEVSNDRLMNATSPSIPLSEAFKVMDNALVSGIDSVYVYVSEHGFKDTGKIKALMIGASKNLLDK